MSITPWIGELVVTATAVHLSAHLTIIHPRMARRDAVAMARLVMNDLELDLVAGRIPATSSCVEVVSRWLSLTQTDPDLALAKAQAAIGARRWATLLENESGMRLLPQSPLQPAHLERISGHWQALGEVLQAYAIEGSPFWFVRRVLPRPSLGASLARRLLPLVIDVREPHTAQPPTTSGASTAGAEPVQAAQIPPVPVGTAAAPKGGAGGGGPLDGEATDHDAPDVTLPPETDPPTSLDAAGPGSPVIPTQQPKQPDPTPPAPRPVPAEPTPVGSGGGLRLNGITPSPWGSDPRLGPAVGHEPGPLATGGLTGVTGIPPADPRPRWM